MTLKITGDSTPQRLLGLIHVVRPARYVSAEQSLLPAQEKALASMPAKFTPRLLRLSLRAERILEGATEPMPSASHDVQASPFCVECGYDLRGQDDAESRCPECGWQWSPGDRVLFGAAGKKWSGIINRRAEGGAVQLVPWKLRYFAVSTLPFAVMVVLILFADQFSTAVWWAVVISVAAFSLLTNAIVQMQARVGDSSNDSSGHSKRSESDLELTGLDLLRLSADGVVQQRGIQRDLGLWPWEKTALRVHASFGGVRVRAGRRRWTGREYPIDFFLPSHTPRETARELRGMIRRLRQGNVQSGQ